MRSTTAFITGLVLVLLLCSVSGGKKTGGAPRKITVWPTKKNSGLQSDNWSYWCSSVVKDSAGLYHMFATRFARHCGLNSWSTNSEIVHAVSTDPLGPFTEREVVVPVDAHNATIFKDKDGSYLLFYFGKVLDTSAMPCNCGGGQSISLTPHGQTVWTCFIEVRRAPTLNGPWGAPVRITHLLHVPPCATNPAPVLEPDGSISLFYRAYKLAGKKEKGVDDKKTAIWPLEYIYRLKAKKWNGVYTATSLKKVMDDPAEDPFVWKDGQGYNMVYNNKFNYKFGLGGYAFSADGNKFVPQPPIYSLKVSYTDGTEQTLVSRERPYIIWVTDTTGVLYNGVRPEKKGDKSYVLAVPVTRARQK